MQAIHPRPRIPQELKKTLTNGRSLSKKKKCKISHFDPDPTRRIFFLILFTHYRREDFKINKKRMTLYILGCQPTLTPQISDIKFNDISSKCLTYHDQCINVIKVIFCLFKKPVYMITMMISSNNVNNRGDGDSRNRVLGSNLPYL